MSSSSMKAVNGKLVEINHASNIILKSHMTLQDYIDNLEDHISSGSIGGGGTGGNCSCDLQEITDSELEHLYGSIIPSTGDDPTPPCPTDDMVEITDEELEDLYGSIIPSDDSIEILSEITDKELEDLYGSVIPDGGSGSLPTEGEEITEDELAQLWKTTTAEFKE